MTSHLVLNCFDVLWAARARLIASMAAITWNLSYISLCRLSFHLPQCEILNTLSTSFGSGRQAKCLPQDRAPDTMEEQRSSYTHDPANVTFNRDIQ